MEDRIKEAQRKIDRIPAKSPLQENIKEGLQGILDLIKMLSTPMYIVDPEVETPVSVKPGKVIKITKSKTPVISPPPSSKLELGPDPRDGEAKAELNFDLEA